MRLFVSTLLLIFVTAVTTTYAVYPWIMSFIEKTLNQQLYLESAQINDTHITATIRNIGKTTLTITKAQINDTPSSINPTELPPQSTTTIYLAGTYIKGNDYKVTLTCSNGYTFTFHIQYT
jgi:P pilus assembly chaperone PapD